MKAAVIQCADYFPRKKKISLKVSFDVSINYLNDRIYLGFPPNRISIISIFNIRQEVTQFSFGSNRVRVRPAVDISTQEPQC